MAPSKKANHIVVPTELKSEIGEVAAFIAEDGYDDPRRRSKALSVFVDTFVEQYPDAFVVENGRLRCVDPSGWRDYDRD